MPAILRPFPSSLHHRSVSLVQATAYSPGPIVPRLIAELHHNVSHPRLSPPPTLPARCPKHRQRCFAAAGLYQRRHDRTRLSRDGQHTFERVGQVVVRRHRARAGAQGQRRCPRSLSSRSALGGAGGNGAMVGGLFGHIAEWSGNCAVPCRLVTPYWPSPNQDEMWNSRVS